MIYIAGPVFKAYWDHQSPLLSRLVLALIDQIFSQPVARLEASAQIELSLLRKGNDLVMHLVNHAGQERLSGWVFPVTEYIPEIRGIKVMLRTGRRRLEIVRVPGKKTISCKIDKGYSTFCCPPLHEMESFFIKGYFGSWP